MSFVYCTLVFECYVFFFKQKTAYELRISDWSSDVCSSDLIQAAAEAIERPEQFGEEPVGGSLRHFRLALLLDACGLRQQCFEPAGSFRLSSQDSRIVGRQAKPTLITAALGVRQFGKRPLAFLQKCIEIGRAHV